MIRKLAETLLDEANLPPEWRETFFPTPPTQHQRPPEIRQAEQQRPPFSRLPQEAEDIEAIVRQRLGIDEEAAPRSPRVLETARRVESEMRAERQAALRADLRAHLRDPVSLRRSILISEILRPPRSLRRPGEEPGSW